MDEKDKGLTAREPVAWLVEWVNVGGEDDKKIVWHNTDAAAVRHEVALRSNCDWIASVRSTPLYAHPSPAVVGEGWKLVPVEPTEDMDAAVLAELAWIKDEKQRQAHLAALRKAGEGAVAWRWRWHDGQTWILSQSEPDDNGLRVIEQLYAHPSTADRKAGEGAVLKGVSKLPWCVGEIESRHDGIGRVRSFTVEDVDGRVVMDATNSSVAEIQSEHDGEPEGHVHHWDEQSRKDAHLIVSAVNAYCAHPSPAVPVGWRECVAVVEAVIAEHGAIHDHEGIADALEQAGIIEWRTYQGDEDLPRFEGAEDMEPGDSYWTTTSKWKAMLSSSPSLPQQD